MVDGTRQKVLMVDGGMHDYDVEPIPITEELLLEIYEKCNKFNELSYIGSDERWLYVNIFLTSEIRLIIMYIRNSQNECELQVLKHNGSEFGGDTILCEANFVRNLHQLENFVFLATGLELIDE